MKLLRLFRWVFTTALVLVALFYLYMARSEKDRSPAVITRNTNPFQPLLLTGDYQATIRLQKSTIRLKESITFSKSDLDTLVAKDLYGGITRSAYLQHMGTLGWYPGQAPAGKITLRKTKTIPYQISLLQKTKNIAVPLLYTPDSLLTGTPKQGLALPGTNYLPYGLALDYTPSENSKIRLLARRGQVLATYPPTTPHRLLDADDNELFIFDPKQIQPLALDEQDIYTTTVNFQLLHPFYNNTVGQLVKDWSAGKIIGWLLVSLAALFADKIKAELLQPLVQRILTPPKKKVKQPRNQPT